MTVTLINLLPNSAACSAGTGDLCPDSVVTTPSINVAACNAPWRSHEPSPLPACRLFRDQRPAGPLPSRRFENPFKPHK